MRIPRIPNRPLIARNATRADPASVSRNNKFFSPSSERRNSQLAELTMTTRTGGGFPAARRLTNASSTSCS
jgi:hypothetical protein